VDDGTIAGKANLRKYHRKKSSALYHNNPTAQPKIRTPQLAPVRNRVPPDSSATLLASLFLIYSSDFFVSSCMANASSKYTRNSPFLHQIQQSESLLFARETAIMARKILLPGVAVHETFARFLRL
jgi:hypothetical protein